MAIVVQGIDKVTGEKESVESLIRRWKKKVKTEGTLEILQERRYFKPKSIKRREKSLKAQIRARKGNKGNY